MSFPPPIGVEGRLQREPKTLHPRFRGDDQSLASYLPYFVFADFTHASFASPDKESHLSIATL